MAQNMRRIIIQVEEDKYQMLREKAFKEHKSISAIVREAIDSIGSPRPGLSVPSSPKEN